MRKYVVGLALIALVFALYAGSVSSQTSATTCAENRASTLNCMIQGGARWVVGSIQDVVSGGGIHVKSGGSLILDSGATFTLAGAPMSAGTVTLTNATTIDDAVGLGTITLHRSSTGTVLLTATDDDANAALSIAPGGTGALTIGGASSGALRINSGTNGTVLLGRSDAGVVTVTAADNDATAALSVLPGGAAALTLGGASATSIALTTDGGTVTIDGSITTPAAGAITGATSVAVTGATGVLTVKAQGAVVTMPGTQTIGSGGTIAGDACGGLKAVTAAGAVSTDTTNTFTVTAAALAGCVMDVCNVGTVNTITLDHNAAFFTLAGADLALAANTCVRVGNDGTLWRQLSALLTAS